MIWIYHETVMYFTGNLEDPEFLSCICKSDARVRAVYYLIATTSRAKKVIVNRQSLFTVGHVEDQDDLLGCS